MNRLSRPINSLLRDRAAFICGTAVLLVLVWIIDTVTGPTINLSILYFLPIIYAAWRAGRNFAFLAAVISEIPTYMDQTMLISTGAQSLQAGVSTVIVRLLVYLFVAHVTSALVARSAEVQRESARILSLGEELRTSYSHLDEDMKVAGVLQASVMSFSRPTVPGCEVGSGLRYARPVGGDFADAGLRNGRVYICVADIAGKGVTAAMFTALLKHLLRNAIRESESLPDLIAYLDAGLSERLPEDRFATLFYAEIDPLSGIVEYVNAGHLEGLVYRRATGMIELVPPTHPLLGLSIVPGSDAPSQLQLEIGDVLALYTDGATESMTTTGERLGDEMVRDLLGKYVHLSAQEMVDEMLTAIESITDRNSRDDLTIVCAKRTVPA